MPTAGRTAPVGGSVDRQTLDDESTPQQLQTALTAIDGLISANEADPDAHYARGVVLRALDRPSSEVLSASQRAFALDPTHGSAAYNIGANLGRQGDDSAALQWFLRATSINAADIDAHYNAGQAAYNLGQYPQALNSFLCARALTPEPFGETKKVVQALHALGRFEEAVVARQEMWRIRAASANPRLNQMDQTVIDQFRIEGRLIMVSETVPPATPPDLRYVYIARAYGDDGRQVTHQAQLETSRVATEMGTAALVGYQQGEQHVTTRIGFEQMPSYEQARPTLQDVIGRLIRGETIPSGASSSPQ